MRHFESLKRIIVLWLGFLGLLFHTAVYAFIWMQYYYPTISKFTIRFKFNQNGHLAMFGIYFILLFFFTSTYGGLKIGYLKTMDVFLSQLFSLLFVNVITYLQISLMNNWWLEPEYFIGATILPLLFYVISTFANIPRSSLSFCLHSLILTSTPWAVFLGLLSSRYFTWMRT